MVTKTKKTLGVLLGRNIAERRKLRGITQNDLAEILGVEPITISRFERGSHLPTLPRLEQIANALGVSVGDFLVESSSHGRDQALVIDRYLSTLSENDRRFVAEMVKHWCSYLADEKR